ncbi:uncharacterized protein [Lolium perenne]|uniref:uncharacterized protein n=1 Tax=Lolium perenne TaxID=4522 RepID=UPI0021F51B68|nr:uncharacterized protein LOC127298741 [Lolium perenne]
MYGLGHVDLSFWELPLSDSVKPRIENTRLGRVTVSGGSLSVDEVITQLQWFVPDDLYEWEVQEVETNVLRVNFPSKLDLVRVQRFGRYNIPDSDISISFDFWKKEVEPVWAPEDIWVRVHKLPPFALDDFLAMWALGDVFGKTKDIDIVFTRANNVLRMLITCLDPSLIPATWDLKIKNDFYRLRFEVEGREPNISPDITMTAASGEDEDPNGNGSGQFEDKVADRDIKRSKGDSNKETQNDINTKSAQSKGNSNNLANTPVQFGSLDVTKLKNDWSDGCVLNTAEKGLYEASGQQMPAVHFPKDLGTVQGLSADVDVATSHLIMDVATDKIHLADTVDDIKNLKTSKLDDTGASVVAKSSDFVREQHLTAVPLSISRNFGDESNAVGENSRREIANGVRPVVHVAHDPRQAGRCSQAASDGSPKPASECERWRNAACVSSANSPGTGMLDQQISPRSLMHAEPNLHGNGCAPRASVLGEAKKFSREEIIAFGGISEESIRGT